MHSINPKLLSGEERRAEIASLLATAILRHRTRQASQRKQESALAGLDCQDTPRLHAAGMGR